MSDFLPDDYYKMIDEAVSKKEKFVSCGKAESYDHYREMVGKIAGLKEALEIFKRCMKMHGVDDD